MKYFTNKSATFAVFAFTALFSPVFAAEEEVVTTTNPTSSSSTDAAATSADANGTATSTTGNGNFGATAASSGAVTSSTGTPTLERNSSGVGVFSPTPLQISATVSGGYDDNVSTAHTNKQSSAFAGANAILDYTFGDPRLQLVLNGGGGLTYYFSHISNQDYDIDLKGALGITYKASPRLTLGGSLLVDYLTEPSFQYTGGLNSRNGNYLYTTDRAFLQYAWTQRFATRTSYTFEAYNYDKNTVAVFSNRVSNLFGNEFRFQWLPTTSLIAEYRYGIITYEHEGDVVIPAQFNIFGMQIAPPVRLEQDSTTHYALVGFDHAFNPRLSATFRGGAQFRSYDNDGDRTAPYFESNVNYALGRRTSVSWVSHYGIEEPDLPSSQNRTTFRSGLQTKFSLTSRTSAAVDLFYVHDDYHSLNAGLSTAPAFSEDTFDAGLTLRYGITGLLGVQVGYHYTDVTSDVAAREYSRNRVSGGVNVTF